MSSIAFGSCRRFSLPANDFRKNTNSLARLQRVLRIAVGLVFFGAAVWMSTAMMIGFDVSRAGWRDYLMFAFPTLCLVSSGLLVTYKPKPTITAAGVEKKPFPLFRFAIIAALGNGLFDLLRAPPTWSGMGRSLMVTAGAVLMLFILFKVIKPAPKVAAGTDDKADDRSP